jgi:hypothetical protein
MVDSQELSIKDVILCAPLLGSLLALSFGAGSFFALGANYLMLFSLSEHLTAALAALPFATIVALGVIGIPFMEKIHDSIKKSELVYGFARRHLFLTSVLALVLLIGAVLITAFSIKLLIADGFPAFVPIPIIIVGGAIAYRMRPRYPILTLYALLVVSVVTSFLLGFGIEGHVLQENDEPYIVTTSGVEHRGVLLYGGDKGILFYDSEARRTRYFRWEWISALSRDVPPAAK